MKTKNNDIIMQNSVFIWLALTTGLILLMPLIMMRITNEMNWTLFDFIVAGMLIYGAGSLYVLAARKWPKHRLIAGVSIALGLLYVWAELAVGIFTNWGS